MIPLMMINRIGRECHALFAATELSAMCAGSSDAVRIRSLSVVPNFLDARPIGQKCTTDNKTRLMANDLELQFRNVNIFFLTNINS
jgi:hypothetical protein